MKKMIVAKEHKLLQDINQTTDDPGIRVSDYSKGIGYKINIQMWVVFLYTSNE